MIVALNEITVVLAELSRITGTFKNAGGSWPPAFYLWLAKGQTKVWTPVDVAALFVISGLR